MLILNLFSLPVIRWLKLKGMFVGQKVRVRLIDMDPYKGQIDFEKN